MRPRYKWVYYMQKAKLKVVIRKGTARDIPAIKPCLIDSWVMHSRHEPRLLDERRMRSSDIEKYYKDALKNPDCNFLVAEANGEFAGFIRADIKNIAGFFKHNRILYLDDVYVLKKFRRHGIAKSLLYAAERIAKARRIKRLQGRVYTFNKSAQKLLKSAGYNYPHSTWDKVID